jgi:isopenicillin-N epimerase
LATLGDAFGRPPSLDYRAGFTLVSGGRVTCFGHSKLELWGLDPAVTYLNHGTVGATPKRVLAAQTALREEIERQPSRFMLREMAAHIGATLISPPRMRAAAATVADFLGARADDLVFVDNATTGANAVLRSLPLNPDDEILVTDHGYGAVTYAANYAARVRGARVRTVELPFPVSHPGAIVEAVASALGPRTVLAIIDHVTSGSAIVTPVADIAARCRARGVAVLVDGAHAPGALSVDIPSLGVDWYAANLHKWAWAPRSSGILWAAPGRQQELHPTVISWGLDQGFLAEFDWVGTRDPSPWLAAPEGIAMLRDLGAEAVRDYNHGLALETARRLRDGVGAEIMVPDAMTGTMTTVGLPQRFGSDGEHANRLRDALLFEDGIEVQMHAWRDRLWVRVSAQIYNDTSDVDRLVRALDQRHPA